MQTNKSESRPSILSQYKVELIPTNLAEFKTVAPPPKGFDPFQATPDELHRHHLPHRPDPRASMAAAKAWRKAMSRTHTYVVPRLKPGNRTRRASLGNLASLAKHDTQSGWAGIIASEGSFTQVWCIFVYPNVAVPKGPVAQPVASGTPNYTFNAWIGLDGTDGSGDVCQAGVETDLYVKSDGTITTTNTYPWVEWFPLNTIVENFTISPGDTIGLIIQYLGVSDNQFQASVHFSNLTTGIAITPIILTAPYGTLQTDNALYQGNTAEWIVEPSAYTNQGIYSAIAEFGDLIFVDAGALSQPGGSKGSVIYASNETQETNIVVNNDTVASEISTPALQISYLPTAGPQREPGIEQSV